ncbi:MAG: hypothetical protein VW683_17335 [Betaproteobacteria bacterium]
MDVINANTKAKTAASLIYDRINRDVGELLRERVAEIADDIEDDEEMRLILQELRAFPSWNIADAWMLEIEAREYFREEMEEDERRALEKEVA